MARNIVAETVQPAPTGRMPGEPERDPLDEEAPTPEEQQFYDTFLNKAFEFIHGPKSSRAVIQHLNQKDMSVQEAVGRTAAMIAKNIVDSAKMANVKVVPEAIFGAAPEVIEELFDIGHRAGIFPIDWPEDDKAELSPEQEKMAQDAFALAAQHYGDDLLKSGDAGAISADAQTQVLRQVQAEQKAGTANPDFMVTNGNTVEGGVKRALMASQGQ